jgi:hypothetical protein
MSHLAGITFTADSAMPSIWSEQANGGVVEVSLTNRVSLVCPTSSSKGVFAQGY